MAKPSIVAALASAVELGRSAPLPGSGQTRVRWQLLAALAAQDLTVARVSEAHLDALAILAEVGDSFDEASDEPLDRVLSAQLGVTGSSTWGVFAAEGPDSTLRADEADGHWRLTGSKPWCSLAADLTHALVTAQTAEGRRLFAISLTHPGVLVRPGAWVSRGLADVASGPISLELVPGAPVGDVQWYLERPGFSWGGLGVAACWYGGAVGLAHSYASRLAKRPPDQIALMHLGAIDTVLYAVRATLSQAAQLVDGGAATGAAGARLALRVRTSTATAAEEVLQRVGHASGPGPLACDEEHARRVADLTIYLRQHHAERDQAALGSLVMTGTDSSEQDRLAL